MINQGFINPRLQIEHVSLWTLRLAVLSVDYSRADQSKTVNFTALRLPILKTALRILHAAEGHYPILMPKGEYPGFLVIIHARPILPFPVSLHLEGLQHRRVVNWSQ